MSDIKLSFGEDISSDIAEIAGLSSEYKDANVEELTDRPKLTEEELRQVAELAQNIDLNNSNGILTYGAAAQNKIAGFSESVLQNVRTKDSGEVGADLEKLVVEITSFDEDDEKFLGLFKKNNSISRKIKKMQARYNSVDTNIDKIVENLNTHKITLIKDMKILDQLYDNNKIYFKELNMYILAGEDKLKYFNEVEIPKQRAIAEAGNDQMEIEKLKDMINNANRFEKKLYDLKLTRTISVQMAPQIRLLQNNNVALVEKIQSSIVNSIPLWKNQMVIALGLANSKSALEAQTKVTDMTDRLIKKNSEMLKTGTIEVARESERGIVAIETLETANKNLLETITSVMDIQKKGSEERKAAQERLIKIESEIKQTLLSTLNR